MFLVLSVGPVRMFLVLGAENLRSILLAMTSNDGVEMPLDWFDSDWEACLDELCIIL